VTELDHLVREPAGEPEGALILNHGRGTDELDPERRLVGVTPGAPLTGIPPGGKHWYLVPRVGYPDPETFASSYSALTSFLNGFLAERGIGWERTVVGGFSMGAVMSYAVGLGQGRPSPAAILAFSGFIPTVPGWQAELESRRGLPVLIHHGRMDPIIDVGFGRRAHELLEPAGLDVEYLETDAAHWLPPEVVERGAEVVRTALDAAGPG
jgi:phospholipase/carboxylesterase